MAQMTLTDFDNELIARGFDAFSQPTRVRYINWGYRRIARRARWIWEQQKIQVDLSPGDDTTPPQIGIGAQPYPADGLHPIGNLKAVDKVYVVAPTDLRAKLQIVSDDEFFQSWLPLDLTNAQNRGHPAAYYWYDDFLYILPPPDQNVSVVVHYKQQVMELIGAGDIPITPPELDEAIVTAALIRCHKRANEIGLAQSNAADLEEIFSDMATDETFHESEELERVSPDDQWL